MKDFAQILKSLGLNDSEIKTYLAALRQGASTVVELTKHTHLSRQAVYQAIESMTERGLMSSVLRGKKRLFTAETPDKLLSYAKRQEAVMRDQIMDLEKSLPELELQLGGERPIVRMYEGKEGIRAFLEEMMKTKPEYIHEIADADALHSVITPEEMEPYRKVMSKHRSKVKGIYTGTVKPNTNPDVHRVALDHPKERFHANISVLGDHVGFVSFEGKMFTVILENKAIAKALTVLIDLAYEEAKRKGKEV